MMRKRVKKHVSAEKQCPVAGERKDKKEGKKKNSRYVEEKQHLM